jgi:hypothetical protein
VTLIPVKGVLGAPELVGGILHGQESVAADGSPKGEEKRDDLDEEGLPLLRRQPPGALPGRKPGRPSRAHPLISVALCHRRINPRSS